MAQPFKPVLFPDFIPTDHSTPFGIDHSPHIINLTFPEHDAYELAKQKHFLYYNPATQSHNLPFAYITHCYVIGKPCIIAMYQSEKYFDLYLFNPPDNHTDHFQSTAFSDISVFRFNYYRDHQQDLHPPNQTFENFTPAASSKISQAFEQFGFSKLFQLFQQNTFFHKVFFPLKGTPEATLMLTLLPHSATDLFTDYLVQTFYPLNSLDMSDILFTQYPASTPPE